MAGKLEGVVPLIQDNVAAATSPNDGATTQQTKPELPAKISFHFGLPGEPRCWSYDETNKQLAVGFNNGKIAMYPPSLL